MQLSRFGTYFWCVNRFELDKKKAESLPDVIETLFPYEEGYVLELDELWSFVYCEANKCWIWIALCKRTRQIVSWGMGNRDEERCQTLWNLIPDDYKQSMIYSDFYATYQKSTSGTSTSSSRKGFRID